MLGKFGKFTLVERIAEGGMAEVFKATVEGPEGFERIVAIKRLHRALCEDADLTQMLVDEARIAAQLHHPNIGNVFDLGCIENQYFIIMEYIDGTDMLRLLDKTRKRNNVIPIPASLFMVSETLSGLHYAHTKLGRNGEPLGIVHRDVSPQNIMVTWDGRVKLVDFGIAKARNRAQTTQAGIIKGKYFYMAPEQAHGHHVDPRTDVYAAGMVLYESIVGHSPYEDIPEVELLRHVRQADFPPPSAYRSDLDPELSALVEIATQRNPEKRFSNAMEFQLALNDYRHRKLGAFAEPHLARTVADVEKGSGSNDNFRPMERGSYRPSDESLLFDKPDEAALAAAGGGAIDNGNQNPFGDDQPTEIYQPDRHPRRDLPPGPGQQQRQQVPAGFGTEDSSGTRTQGGLPSNRGPQSGNRRAGPSPRSAESTKPSVVDRLAKPKYIYLAIGLATLLVAALAGVLLFVIPETGGGEEKQAEASAADAVDKEPTGPTTVGVALNSTPSNAEVIIDGEGYGTTPMSVDLEVGKSYRVEFLKDGYQVDTQNVLVSDSPSDVTATLEEARGILKILSFPPDADITVEGAPQGNTPLTLTGLETDKNYEISAKLGDQEMARSVEWDDENQSVQEVMFEFEQVEGERLTLNVPDEKKTKKRRSRPKRRTYRRRRRKRKPKPKPKPAQEEEVDENLDVFGDGSGSSSSSDEEDEELDVWGGSGSSSSKKKTKKKPKKEAEEDEDLDIW